MKNENVLIIAKQLMYIRENARELSIHAGSTSDVAYDKAMLIIDEVNKIYAALESEATEE